MSAAQAVSVEAKEEVSAEQEKEGTESVFVEMVRAALAEKSRAGKIQEVRVLLKEFGADKLSAMKRELQITEFQLSRFNSVDENDIIEAMQFSHPEGERVQSSTLSDKTAKATLNYKNIAKSENDEWFDFLIQRHEYLREELDSFTDSISKLPGVLPGIITDLLDGGMTWDMMTSRYHVSWTMISKYKKSAIKELDIMYEMWGRQTDTYILG